MENKQEFVHISTCSQNHASSTSDSFFGLLYQSGLYALQAEFGLYLRLYLVKSTLSLDTPDVPCKCVLEAFLAGLSWVLDVN